MLSPSASDTPVAFGRFVFIPARYELLADGQSVKGLGQSHRQLLAALLERPGQLVERNQLIERGWPGRFADSNNLRGAICGLRKVLGEGVIDTANGWGYRFVAPVTAVAEPTAVVSGAVPPPMPSVPVLPERLKTNLPPLVPSLLGRDDTLSELGDLVDAHRLVTLHGAGGIGKSCVAQVFLDGRRGRYRHGVCWVELGALTDAADLPGTIAGALGIAAGANKPVQALCKALASLEVLVALDGAEHLLEGLRGLLPQLLATAPGLRLLLTSQAQVLLPGEQPLSLDGLAAPSEAMLSATMRADAALAFPAVKLFVDRARVVDRGFSLTDDDVPVVSALCETLDGLPLAIELAAARMNTLGLRPLLAAMGRRFELLTTSRNPTAPARQKTLAAAFDWSYGLLPEREQTLFRRLGVLAGSATLDLIQQVAADGKRTARDAAAADVETHDALNVLIDLSLVSVLHTQPRRFRLFESARLYARERLEAKGESRHVRSRHTAAMAAMFDALWDEAFSGSTGLDALYQRVEPDFDNARVAWLAARAGRMTPAALRIAAGLLLLLPESRLAESAQMADGCELLLDGDPFVPPALALRAWLSVAYARRMGAPQRLRRPAVKALWLARRLDSPHGDRLPLFLALCLVAMARTLAGRDRAARRSLDRANAIADKAWPPQRLVVQAAAEELYARRFADSTVRLRRCRDWLALDRARGFLHSPAAVNVIDCELAEGNLEAAERAGRRALEDLQGTRNALGLAHARLHLAAALLAMDRPDEALPLCQEGWPQALQFGLQAVWADILAELAARRQQPEAAAQLLGYASAQYAHRPAGHQHRELTHARSEEQTMKRVHEALGSAASDRLRLDGQALSESEVPALAFAAAPPAPVVHSRTGSAENPRKRTRRSRTGGAARSSRG